VKSFVVFIIVVGLVIHYASTSQPVKEWQSKQQAAITCNVAILNDLDIDRYCRKEVTH